MSTQAPPAASPSEGRGWRERDLQRQFAEFLANARELLGADLPSAPGTEMPAEAVPGTITAVAMLVLEELRMAKRRTERTAALCRLAAQGALLDGGFREQDLRRRKRALAGFESALGRLRHIGSPDELIDAVCPELVRSCGFGRVMLSRVTGTTWRPWKAHFTHRPTRPSDEQWMADMQIPMSTMVLERESIETGHATWLLNPAEDPRTPKAFIEATGTKSYAVAPIVPAGRVIGLLHADFYPSPRAVDAVDAHILGAFADGFGRIYERAVLAQRLERERDHVRNTLKRSEEIMDNLARAEVELVRRVEERSAAGTVTTLVRAGGAADIDELLTPREREVMALLVTGQTNSAIAERLVISEGTVKSHVKQILRKLGAVNRSEVIARYLGIVSQG